MASQLPTSTLNELAAQIGTLSKTLTDYLNTHNLPQPSFAADAPPSLSKEAEHVDIEGTRLELITVAEKLRDLAMGPDEFMLSNALLPKFDMMTIYVIDVYKIPQAVPLHGEVSFRDIAAKVGLSEGRLVRLLRYAMTMRVFCEPRAGFVAHTAASATWLRTPNLSAWIAHNMEERVPGCIRIIDALRMYDDSEDPGDTAVHLALGIPRDMNMYEFIASDGEGDQKGWKLKRFGQAMAYIGGGTFGMTHIHKGFDWKALGDGTIVDVGGSTGHLSFELAKVHPSLKCIVQDLPGLEEGFHAAVPGELKSRVTFQAHDFFTPQTSKDADLYILRHILHNWPDPLAVKILRNIVLAMKDSARIVIVDTVLPPPGSCPVAKERFLRGIDIQMMVARNAKERTQEDWIELIGKTDKRLRVENFAQPPQSEDTFIEIIFNAAG